MEPLLQEEKCGTRVGLDCLLQLGKVVSRLTTDTAMRQSAQELSSCIANGSGLDDPCHALMGHDGADSPGKVVIISTTVFALVYHDPSGVGQTAQRLARGTHKL